ncbi:MAG: MarR family transcriptional regulator [Lentisphaeria bacterium]|nr:MarR family transcriptional regulator [Lentisphaeria bacterium]
MKNRETAYSDLWRAVFRIGGYMRERNIGSEDKNFYRLTYNQLRMIQCVYVCGPGLSLKSLAEKLGITPAAASEMVNTLVRKGVLTRQESSRDRRAISISISDEYQSRFKHSEELFDNVTAGFMDTVDPREREIFAKVLRQWDEYAGAGAVGKQDRSS